jgi:maleylpyruvate isomerase
MMVPAHGIDRVDSAHRWFVAHIERLDEDELRRDSLLPTWTIGHVLAHVARNADSHVRRTQAAIKGAVVDQYVGGADGRAAQIEATARQPAAQLIDDVKRSAEAVVSAWRSTPADAWTAISRDVSGRERPLYELPARRWQEVEIHLVDLGIGFSYRDWTDEFVAAWLPQVRARMADRLPKGCAFPHFEDRRDELAWLYGRLQRKGSANASSLGMTSSSPVRSRPLACPIVGQADAVPASGSMPWRRRSA